MVKITKTNKQRINLCYLPLLKSSSLPDIICCHLRRFAWHHHFLPSPAFFPAYPIRAHLSVYLLPQAGRASFVWVDTSKAGTWERKGLISTIHIVPHDAGSGGRWPDRGHLVCCTKMHIFLFQLLWDVKGLGEGTVVDHSDIWIPKRTEGGGGGVTD